MMVRLSLQLRRLTKMDFVYVEVKQEADSFATQIHMACDMTDNTDWAWDTLRDSNDINVSLSNWEQQFMNIMSESIPKSNFPKKLTSIGCQKSLIQAMRKHNYLYRRAKRIGIYT